jgi:amino acid transporter
MLPRASYRRRTVTKSLPETPPAELPVTAEADLDAGAYDDDAYLAELGYKPQLNRALGLFSSFAVQFSMVAIGSATFTTLIVGLGFFGPASFWSFLAGGAGQMIVGLVVAELVSCYPLAGGVYQITNRLTHNPFLGFVTGWAMVIAHVVSVPAIAVSIAPFVGDWFGWDLDPTGTKLLVIGMLALTTFVNLAGVKIAAFVNNAGVLAELIGFAVIIVALIVWLVFSSHGTHGVSILTDAAGTTDSTSWVKAFAFALILPAYMISSFDSTGNTAEETHDAARSAPRGVIYANFLSYIYGAVGIALILLAIRNLDQVMGSDTPVKLILTQSIGSTLSNGFEVMAVVALFAAMVMLQLTAARVLWSQARDGQLPVANVMKKVNSHRVPHVAVLVTLVLSVVIALWSSLLSVLTAFTALAWATAYFVVVVAGYFALRRKKLPHHPWGYGRWSKPLFALAIFWSVVLCAVLVWSDVKHVGGGMVGALAAGVVLWYLIPRSRRGKVVGVTATASDIELPGHSVTI